MKSRSEDLPNPSPAVATYDLVSDLDEAGDKAIWATIERILASRATAAEQVGLPDGSHRTETVRSEK